MNSQNSSINPVALQIQNPQSDQPVFTLPAVQDYIIRNEKQRDFSAYVIPTAYDLLLPELVRKNSQALFYGK